MTLEDWVQSLGRGKGHRLEVYEERRFDIMNWSLFICWCEKHPYDVTTRALLAYLLNWQKLEFVIK